MATGIDVQIELGNWAKVHNLLLEQLAKTNLTGRESKCLFHLLRMTYGNQVKQHEISLSLWAEGTKIDKRHVKGVIDGLIARGIIYRVDGKRGRGNTAIYGFNKYFEGWDSAEKVPSTVPIKKVPDTVPFDEKKVPSTVPEKVPSTVPIKERSSKEQPAAAFVDDEDGDSTMALVRMAYQSVCKIGPSTRTDDGRANLVTASRLIERYGFPACVRGISTLKERNDARIRKNVLDAIRSPVAYLQTLMEDEIDSSTDFSVAATVDFAFEEIAL